MDRGNLEINDVVLLKDDVQPRNLWRLARVIKTYPDERGIVRSVRIKVGDRNVKELKTSNCSEYHRPVNKLILLEKNGSCKIPDEEAREEREEARESD